MDPKSVIERRIRAAERGLVDLSHRIHAHPELAFQEIRASDWVAQQLSEAGFEVEHGCYGLPTAVRATVGSGPLHIAVCAEYDALPEIGHACGHNVIAAAAVGATSGWGASSTTSESRSPCSGHRPRKAAAARS